MGAGDYINDRKSAEQQNAVEQNRSSWLVPMAAGLGVIALGAVALKTRLSTGNKTLSNLFNFLGIPRGINLADVAANTGKSTAQAGTAGIKSVEDATFDLNRNRLNIGPIDIIDDLRNTVEFMGMHSTNANSPAYSIAEFIKQKTIEFTHRELVNGGNNAGYFTQGLERVTFKKVLEDQGTWSTVLGNEQWSVLHKSRELGLINDTMVMDKRIYFNPKSNQVLDLRLRNLTSSVTPTQVTGQTIFQRTSRFDMFGQAPVFGAIAGLPNRRIALLGRSDTYDRSRVFIDGDIWGFKLNSAKTGYTPQLLDKGRVLRRAGDPLEVIAASRAGNIQLNLPTRTGMMKPMGWMEQNLGIGTAFSSRFNFLERWAINPYKRFRALQTGEGVILRHPLRHAGSGDKIADTLFGGSMPEMIGNKTAIEVVPGGGTEVSLRNLTGRTKGIPNRFAVLFDLHDEYSVVRSKSYNKILDGTRQTLVSKDLVVPIPDGGFNIKYRNIPGNSKVNSAVTDIASDELTAVGYRSGSKRYKYYDAPDSKLAGVKDFASYSLYRLNKLFSESFLGIGMAPDHRFSVNLMRTAAIPFVYEAGKQAALYADHISETFTGISPIKAVASAYAGLRVAQQKVREWTGIQQSAAFLDKYFPGSVNSDASVIARSVVAPFAVANFMMGKGFMGAAVAGAAATYAAIGGSEPGQTTSDLIDEYSGDKKVPVRKGRMWGLGYLPFFGGKPDRFENSWYSKLTSDYRTKSMYGSESEYWSYHANVYGVPLPTPSNLFGLLNILNPYRLENMHSEDRPYAQTSSLLDTFPVIGPLLGATVGQVFKPNRYRQPDKLPLVAAGLAERGLTPSHAEMLGIPAMNATSYEAEDPASALNTLQRQANIASEPLGIYKFAMEFFGVKLAPRLGSQYASSSMMGDAGRAFYDQNFGGMFGQTEMIRRFLVNDYSSPYQRAARVNPIKNNLPTWLPGAYSENSRDREYFTDFTMGDPFVKIEDGEARLPGPGYESLNRLHSGQSGVYSDVDKLLILSDVAPYSNSYKKYEKKVLSMELDDYWTGKVDEAINNRRQVIGVDERYKRYEEDIVAMNMGTIAKSFYEPIRKGYDFLTHDVLAEIPYFGSKFFPFRSPYEQYRKMNVEGSEYASWNTPYEDIVRPALYDMATEDPVTAAGKGAGLGFMIAGPMRWFTPIKSLIGNTSTIAGGAAIGATLSAARIASGNTQDMIPFHIREEEDAIQYMDSINYIKGRMIEKAGGSPQFANKTMMGAPNPISYRSALPRSADRRYFEYFLAQEDQGVRSQIIKGLPDYMTRGLAMSWDGDYYDRSESDAAALKFVNNNEIPDSSWMGWSPEISPSAARLKFVQDGINGVSENMHRFGFYESHEVDLKTRLRDFSSQEINYTQSPMYSNFDSFIENHNSQVSGGKYKLRRFSTPLGSRRNVDYIVDRTKDNNRLIQSKFSQ